MSLHTPSPSPSPRPDTEWDINDISDASVPKVSGELVMFVIVLFATAHALSSAEANLWGHLAMDTHWAVKMHF